MDSRPSCPELSAWSRYLSAALEQADRASRRRQRRALELAELIDFGSNDYLGLRSHPAVLAALQTTNSTASFGAGASPVLCGYSPEHATLEGALAHFANSESALLFSSGYAGNLGTIACLASSEDLILSDRLNHASLIDGCRLSSASKVIYPHLDIGFVRDFLRTQRHRFGKVLLLSETIFSMDGDAAPLTQLADLAAEFDCGLVVDEAHAVGVYGATGSGLLEEFGQSARVLAKLGTLSKAIGCIGGYVAGNADLIEYLVNHCRSYLFSTASPGPVAAAAYQSLLLLQSMHEERLQLRQAARGLRQRFADLGLIVASGDSPIIPIVVGSEANALRLSQRLWEAQLYVPAIRPPTVPPETSRLRVSLSTRHTTEELDRLVSVLQATL